MKAIRFFFASVLTLTFAACYNVESDNFNDNFEDNSSNFESMISLYGIQSATPTPETADVPSVTAEEMRSVLEALRQNGNTVRDCETEIIDDFYGVDSDKKAVKMIAEYQARTRSGAFVEQFALCVSLNFNIEQGSVYYIGATYSSVTDLFDWQGYGTSLSTTATGGSIFNSTTYLYFRVSDQNNCLVKVPVKFKGDYDFSTEQGTYSFSLAQAA